MHIAAEKRAKIIIWETWRNWRSFYQKFSYDFWFYGIMKFKKFGNNLKIVSLIIVISNYCLTIWWQIPLYSLYRWKLNALWMTVKHLTSAECTSDTHWQPKRLQSSLLGRSWCFSIFSFNCLKISFF